MKNRLQTWLGSMISLSRLRSARLALPKGASPSKPLWLPPDGPLDAKGRQRYNEYRLEPLIQALYNNLHGWLAAPQTSIPPRIGVFGGLGQGKSTVVVNVLERLQKERGLRSKIRETLLGPRIIRFDISYFKANDLEWRFLTALLWRRFRCNFVKLGLLSFVAFLIGFFLGCVLQHLSPLAILGDLPAYGAGIWSLTFLGPLFATFIHGLPSWWKTFRGLDPASRLYSAERDQGIKTFSGLFYALPDVVIIDDLDRASVEQQRSFLRAMSRFSRELGFAVVVCMDDSELLAAPPSPEAPEELLRKTITAELRIPDRTREDTALLVAVCVREFARENEALADALTTVQFVSDLTRVLLIEAQQAPASPRKIWRILTTIGLQAHQFKVDSADDLGALLRIDGLFRLLPPLRRHIDRLRRALENQQLEIFNKLLTDLGLDDGQPHLAKDFFQKTRMMQPSIQEGWFRLLAGFGYGNLTPRTYGLMNTWRNDWTIAEGSIDFFRLFAESLELEAIGYPQPLLYRPKDSAADGSLLKVPDVSAFNDDISVSNLPPSFLEPSGKEYFGQCWLIWGLVLVSASVERKTALYHRAYRWIETAPADLQHDLLNLYWREVLADADLWENLDSTSRQAWWDNSHRDAQTTATQAQGIPIQRFFALPLRNEDFTDAFMVFGQIGSIRDGRNGLDWWHHLTPEVNESRLQLVNYPNFAAKIWPAPQPERNDAAAWREVLAQHFKAVNALNKVQRASLKPEPLLYAWQRAQTVLAMDDCIDLINLLACDESAPTGQRWSLETARPWVKGLSEKRREDLATMIKEAPTSSVGISLFPQRRLVLILIAVLLECRPQNPSWLIKGIPPEKLNELLNYLVDVGALPDWLVPTTG